MNQDITDLLGNCNHRSLRSRDHNSNHYILTTGDLCSSWVPGRGWGRNIIPGARWLSPFLPVNITMLRDHFNTFSLNNNDSSLAGDNVISWLWLSPLVATRPDVKIWPSACTQSPSPPPGPRLGQNCCQTVKTLRALWPAWTELDIPWLISSHHTNTGWPLTTLALDDQW